MTATNFEEAEWAIFTLQDTGALKGLYGANEMKSDHAKDRDSKMKYIEKAVFCVSFAVGEALGVKPAKVVAGQEAEKTNEFLQVLARVVKEKIDTKAHVKRVLNGNVLKCVPGYLSGHGKGTYSKMFSESSPCLFGQHGSCSTAQRPGELSENILQNLSMI